MSLRSFRNVAQLTYPKPFPTLYQELNEYKETLLKIIEERNQWEKERGFLAAKIDVLNENQLILERENGDKNEKEVILAAQPSTETNIEAIVQAMSHVILRDKEIIGLKSQNQNLADAIKKKE